MRPKEVWGGFSRMDGITARVHVSWQPSRGRGGAGTQKRLAFAEEGVGSLGQETLCPRGPAGLAVRVVTGG